MKTKNIALALALLALPAVVQAYDYTYVFDGAEIIITGYTGPGGDVAIPDYIDGYPVTIIGSYAFFGVTSLTSVGVAAFGPCTRLTSVTILNGADSIRHGAFYGCTSLTSITIPNSVTSIGGEAFRFCISLTNVTIG